MTAVRDLAVWKGVFRVQHHETIALALMFETDMILEKIFGSPIYSGLLDNRISIGDVFGANFVDTRTSIERVIRKMIEDRTALQYDFLRSINVC